MKEHTYKGVKKKDLPIYDPETMGYQNICTEDEAPWIPMWARTYVRYQRFSFIREYRNVGFYVSSTDRRLMQLHDQARRLARYKGNYVFRYTPVSHVHKFKNWVSARSISGAKAQYQHDVMCLSEIEGKYGKVVRRKRAAEVKYQATDYDHPYRYNEQRGWKRSKKRKQWMK